MEANARNIERIFDSTVSYQIPLFQRPYVWTAEKNWQPLWEDIQALLERNINREKSRAHFLGAVVLEQLNNQTGSIETRQVIDGQQRFTTLQIFMVAVRDLCKQQSNEKIYERFNDLVTNRETKVDYDHESYKIWPTNTDRKAFQAVHAAGSVEGLQQQVKENPDLKQLSHQIIGAYEFFAKGLAVWLQNLTDDDQNPRKSEDCLDALWQVVRNDLQFVVIDLSKEDESQVIFETLNARGTQLLPADLIKNYLFRRVPPDKKDAERLYQDFWKQFDSSYWRAEVKQGRIKRPRIDLFMQHYLTLMLREEIKHSHLFEAFKQYVQDLEDGSISREPGLTAHPDGIEGHLKSLSVYARAFKTFTEPEHGSRLALFKRRLEAVDTATVYPLLLLSCGQLQEKEAELDAFLQILESYLIRRMVCGLTTKNYNRFFIDAIKSLDKARTVSADALERFLQAAEGESTRFPDDAEFQHALINRPIYRYLAQYKVRAVLEGIDSNLFDRKSEDIALPDGLTIEHVMPQQWRELWPIPKEISDDPEAKLEFTQTRDGVLHTLGNLTLITGSLNPSLSNGSWNDKRPELCKFSKLNLNRYFHPPKEGEQDPLRIWNEDTILKRGAEMAQLAVKVWPVSVKY